MTRRLTRLPAGPDWVRGRARVRQDLSGVTRFRHARRRHPISLDAELLDALAELVHHYGRNLALDLLDSCYTSGDLMRFAQDRAAVGR